MNMPLHQLIAATDAVVLEGSTSREVSGMTYDSRRVNPGMVFFAVRGEKNDGHDFISEAIDRGAVAVVCERNGFISHRATKVQVKDCRKAMAQMAAEFYGHPSRRLKMIGVTGTNGKTTIAFLARRLLERAGYRTGLLSTIRYEVGDRVLPAGRTTPEALDLQQLLSQMVRAGCQACVMEVSSHAISQNRILGVEFDIGVFSNLTQDHLDYHGTMENYYSAKEQFFKQLQSGSKSARAVINHDDKYGRRLLESGYVQATSFGLEEPADLVAHNIGLGRQGIRYELLAGDTRAECWVPLTGRHNVSNSLAAIGVALAVGVPMETAIASLAAVQPVPGRLEPVPAGQPFSVYIDYAHTDDALRNVLETLREITTGRILLAFGCGGNRDTTKRVKMGEVAAQFADYTVITSDNPRRESPAAIAAQIEAGFLKVKSHGSRTILDRHLAIEEVISMANPGDIVLIAGKGHETYQELQDTVVPFDDRVHATAILERMRPGTVRQENILHAA